MHWHLVFLCLLAEGVFAENWNYVPSENGPDTWLKHFPVCNHSHQSPININTSNVQIAQDYDPILFVDYDNIPNGWSLTNNGHTLRLVGNFTKWIPQIQAGALPAKYYVVQAHFHWGSDNNRGSEHLLDGKAFPFEMHLVHSRRPLSDYFRDEEDNRPTRNRLAVVAVFFRISTEDNPHLKIIIDRLSELHEADSKAIFFSPDWSLQNLLPDSKDFYRYHGSLTTPPCDEDVVWSVLPESNTISPVQLAQFRRLLTHEYRNLTSNYRPVQSLNNRVVTLSSAQAWLKSNWKFQ